MKLLSLDKTKKNIIYKNMSKEEKCLNLNGEEMVALATSFSLCIAKKMSPKEVCLMRTFFQAVASNLSTIEFTDSVCKNRT